MAQDLQRNPVVNLSRGLVTEQTPLTPVENSTTDELNMNIELDGRRVSRKGLAYLSNRDTAHPSNNISHLSNYPDTGNWSSFVWENPSSMTGVSFLVLQTYHASSAKINFLVLNDLFSIDNQSSQVNVTTTDGSLIAGLLDYTVLDGVLYITGPNVEPIKITASFTESVSTPYYTYSTSRQSSDIKIRDFKFLSDSYKSEVLAPDNNRKYDTYNAGWTDPARDDYGTGAGDSTAYPPLTGRWHSSKESDGTFDYSDFIETNKGNTRVSGGRAIISLHINDGADVTRSDFFDEVEGLTPTSDYIETANTSLNVGDLKLRYCESFAGRIFYAGHPHEDMSNKIYFSQVVEENGNQAFDCYQKNDPTAEILSDPLDSDGGVISIQSMNGCTGLKSFADSILVFGVSGVWAIRPGSSGLFSANSYSIEKISDYGTNSFRSVVVVEDKVFYINKFGVNAISRDANGNLVYTNISREVIQKYWKANYSPITQDVIGEYDPLNKQVHWLFSEDSNSVRTRCLVLDIRNNAFLPWTFDSSLKVRDMFYYTANVTDNATSFEDYGAQPGSSQELPRMMYIVKDSGLLPDDTTMTNGTSAFINDTWNIADMSAPVNVDLKTYSTSEEGVTFSSYIESTPNFYGDMHNDKDTKEVVVYTEKDSEFHFPFPDNFSSYNVETETRVNVKHSWDFEDFENSQAGYEPYDSERIETTPAGTLADNTYVFHKDISIKRLKFRGRGKALKLRFESDGIYPINLIGYSDISSRDRDYDR